MRARERAQKRSGGKPRRSHVWVRYERISPHLRKAVLLAEDASFYQHEGLDFYEIKESIRKDLRTRRFSRGGSTITQQLAKNLWLGEQKTIGRKIEEVVLAIRLERALSKKRILELYLNLIEWGDGVYGAEAAARRWFGKGAADLTVRESAILAGMIPNPRRWNPDRVGAGITWRTRTVLRRLRASGYITPAMFEEIVGGGSPELHSKGDTARVDSLLPAGPAGEDPGFAPPEEGPGAAPADPRELDEPAPLPAARDSAFNRSGISPDG
jgi:monofunctional biosynthetic peptidoglycan transglycosylase